MSSHSGQTDRGAIIVAIIIAIIGPLVVYSVTSRSSSSKEDQIQATVVALQTQLAEARRQAPTSPSPISTPSTSNQQVAQQAVATPTDTPTPEPPTPSPTPEPPTPEPVLFSDDFDNGLNSTWKLTIGEWGVVNGQLRVLRATTPYAEIEVGDDSWDNYSIDFDAGDFERDSWGHFNTLTLYVRNKDNQNAPYFNFSWFQSTCGTLKNGVDTTILDFGSTGQSPHFHIEVKGSAYEIDINGERKCSYDDKAFNKGDIRFRVTNGDIGWPFIDNLVVKHLK